GHTGLGHAAARAFLDTLAVAMPGAKEDSARLARTWALTAAGAPKDDGAAGALGTSAREWATGRALPVAEAAFANGVAAHALDFDDVSMSMSGHPSALLVPVTLAVAESAGASVGQLLEAYVTGLHVNVAVAAGFDLMEHYARGWHASVTVGTLGAVAAAARLLGLDARQAAHAIGLGVSMASGTRQNFGTMTKALHIGLAASSAVRAAQLAALGVDSSADALDGPLGYYSLYGQPAGDPAGAVTAALAGPEGGSLASLSAKRYPCCYQTHRAIDAALDLRDRLGRVTEGGVTEGGATGGGVTEDAIEEIVVHVNPGSDNSLIHPYAATPTQARFCMRYVVAAALLRGEIDFGSFGPGQVGSADIQALMRRVRLEHAAVPPYEPVVYSLDYAAVSVALRSGKSLNQTCVAPRGNAERPLSDDELRVKADACLAEAGLPPAASELAGVLGAPASSAETVIDVLRGPANTGPASTGPARTGS
ncbi:MAG: MmgE/PrpD family protein, partial [Nocardiopsaceae bacterium]|nr:MmgE/PrpD family protein [Nocardiopsaceae bacterium]